MKIIMPQLGETVTEGTISAWYKKAGDEVEKDELLLDVETDKVATEIPAPISGVLRQILVPEGETVDVGTILAVIGDEDEIIDVAAVADTATESGAGNNVPAAAARSQSDTNRAPAASASGAKLSPAVRRLISEHDLDINSLTGTGRDGRLTKQDVLDAIESKSGEAANADANRIPFDRIRRVTADHMVRSKATSPHVLQAIDVDFQSVDTVRLAQRESWRAQHGYSLSYLPFIAKAVCIALVEFPRLNSSVEDQSLVLHKQVNLSIAVDLGNGKGLLAPVIHGAGELTVPELAKRIKDLADRARNQQLSQDDLSGGTYTLSNPGPFGTLFTAPIINQPQVAILSMDAVSKRAVVEEGPQGDEIVIRPVGVLAQSFDHRAVDGAYSAAFLARIKQLIKDQDWSTDFEK
jgi:2-oxoglutarate dehydrogenase E2 component (dihydrolipoamide succinyltransferase)